ncbi:hypothetical protein N781_16650 [Pontibacillus halophilus JSM 076056 = DSM 19796]|uniref:DMT family transporter n=1 Tax=Pontibacillus halophilus JSM 076056 = DSM 19796 TaxID=1385510 RepID=A0A0A5I960_9BACI|nr:DMT family transporter [Pontibacillus halophilus]KGX92377.1 hypothetical protein N781_16650 [Pontibacillus halophilus JSM 076056 = DSM 19796]
MKGLLFSLAAGLCITMQGVFNARLSDELGGWQTTSLNQLVGLLFAIIMYIIMRDGRKEGFKEVPKVYLFGGTFGVIVVFAELTAMKMMGPAFAISILLVSQLLTAYLIESNGWFGQTKVRVTKPQLVGVSMMILGVVVFNL